MTTTLTFRLEASQRKKLRKKARLLGQTESQYLREVLSRELDGGSLADLAALKGSLSLGAKKASGWQKTLRDRNWRA